MRISRKQRAAYRLGRVVRGGDMRACGVANGAPYLCCVSCFYTEKSRYSGPNGFVPCPLSCLYTVSMPGGAISGRGVAPRGTPEKDVR